MQLAIPNHLPDSAPNATLTAEKHLTRWLAPGEAYRFTAYQRGTVALLLTASQASTCYVNETVVTLAPHQVYRESLTLAKGQTLTLVALNLTALQLEITEEF